MKLELAVNILKFELIGREPPQFSKKGGQVYNKKTKQLYIRLTNIIFKNSINTAQKNLKNRVS